MRITDMSHQQDIGLAPVVARAFDREAGEESPRHCHPTAIPLPNCSMRCAGSC